MYKTELIKEVARATRLNQEFVADVLTATLTQIQQTLQQGGEVVLPGFGTFYTRRQPAGRVRHIRTGASVMVPARRVAGFRVGEHLKQAVRKNAKKNGLIARISGQK